MFKWNTDRGLRAFRFQYAAFIADIADWFPEFVNRESPFYYGTNAKECVSYLAKKSTKMQEEVFLDSVMMSVLWLEINVDGKNLYVKQLIYQLGLTNEDLAFKLKDIGIDRNVNVVADSAEPKSIEELKRLGINVRPVNKTSILYGIQKMKQFKIYLHNESVDLISEFTNFKFKKDRTGAITNNTIGKDHLIDALKYGIVQFLDRPKTKFNRTLG